MNLSIDIVSHKTSNVCNHLPSNHIGPRLPGSEVLSASGDFGDLCIQEFNGGNFIIRHSVLRTKETLILNVHSHHAGLHAAMMLKNSITTVFTTGEQLQMPENHFTLFSAHSPAATVTLGSGQHFICFETLLSHDLASSIAHHFPELSASLTAMPAPGPPELWANPPKQFAGEVNDHIQYILTYSDPDRWRRNYFENRVWDITWKLLATHLKKSGIHNGITNESRELAEQVQRIILDKLEQHLYLRDIGKEVGVSVSKIKKTFTAVFGIAVHRFRTAARLKKAVRLLQEGASVKEAAAATGWHPADLIKAFYKAYGTTPGTIRRRKK